MYGSERPLLDARLEGVIYGTATADTTTSFYYNFAGTREFNGVETYAWNASAGDYITLLTEYWSGASWLRYKKFAKKWYIFPDTPQRVILFPTAPKNGIRLRVDYTNTHASQDVTFALNMFKFIEQQTIDISVGEQGENW